jgi:hypothetical protein
MAALGASGYNSRPAAGESAAFKFCLSSSNGNRCPMRRIVLILAAAASVGGCSTSAVVFAPYDKVVAAVGAACAPGAFDELQRKEVSPEEEMRFEIVRGGELSDVSGWRPADRTTIDVKRLSAGQTRIQVKAVSDELIAPVRDVGKERRILDRIRQEIGSTHP